jgi:hypothetical protein
VTTQVTFYTEPLNIDGLMASLRIEFGDIDGSIYSDTTIRTALVNAVSALQRRWDQKYQIYKTELALDPQPVGVPAGYVAANTSHGLGYIPSGLAEGDVFRDPYVSFLQPSPPIIESADERAIVLQAVYILRKMQVSSNTVDLVSWATEDIRYTNTSRGTSFAKLLEQDKNALDDYFRKSIAKPKILSFPVHYIPGLEISY